MFVFKQKSWKPWIIALVMDLVRYVCFVGTVCVHTCARTCTCICPLELHMQGSLQVLLELFA